MSLVIDADLETLALQRQELMEEMEQADEFSSPSREEVQAAIEQTDIALRQYAQELRPAKADAYWWLIKSIGKPDAPEGGKTHVGLIADAKREIARLKLKIDQLDTLRSILEQSVLDSLARRNEKALEGTNGRKLRRQNNGGVRPVEVAKPQGHDHGSRLSSVEMDSG